MEAITNFLNSTGFAKLGENPLQLVMLAVSCVLLYLAIVKKFEPLLLLPIAFGMLLTNLPGAGIYHAELFEGGHVHWEMFAEGVKLANGSTEAAGLLDVLYLGVKLGVYPCLIFIGVGCMTDFGPLIRKPEEPAARRCRTARYLRYLCRRCPARLHPGTGRLHRHHRRCRRPYGHLRHLQART